MLDIAITWAPVSDHAFLKLTFDFVKSPNDIDIRAMPMHIPEATLRRAARSDEVIQELLSEDYDVSKEAKPFVMKHAKPSKVIRQWYYPRNRRTPSG